MADTSFKKYRMGALGSFLSSFFLVACTQASNSFDQTQQTCGVSSKNAVNSLFLKPVVKSPEANPQTQQWSAILVNPSGKSEKLSHTAQGCFALPRDKADPENMVYLRDQLSPNSLTISLREIDLTQSFTSLEINRLAQNGLSNSQIFSCEASLIETRKEIGLKKQSQASDRFQVISTKWQLFDEKTSKKVASGHFFSNDTSVSSINLDEMSIRDGRYRLKIENIDLFNSNSDSPEQSKLSSSCLVNFDRRKPSVRSQLDFSKIYQEKPRVLKLSPGQMITFEASEDVAVFYCLNQITESRLVQKSATKAEEFQNDCQSFDRVERGFISSPQEGIWHLSYYATDKAGNKSELQSNLFAVYHDRMVSSVKEKMQIARLEAMMQNDEESIYSVKASFEEYNLLQLMGEKEELKKPLTHNLWELDQNLRQKASFDLGGNIKNISSSPRGKLISLQVERENDLTESFVLDANFQLLKLLREPGVIGILDETSWYFYNTIKRTFEFYEQGTFNFSYKLPDSIKDLNKVTVSPRLNFIAITSLGKLHVLPIQPSLQKKDLQVTLLHGSAVRQAHFLSDESQLYFQDLNGLFVVDLDTMEARKIAATPQGKKFNDILPMIGRDERPFLLLSIRDLDKKDIEVLGLASNEIDPLIQSGFYRMRLDTEIYELDEINHIFMGYGLNEDIEQKYTYPGYFRNTELAYRPYLLLNDNVSDHFFLIKATAFDDIQAVDFKITSNRLSRIQINPISNRIQIIGDELTVYPFEDNLNTVYDDQFDHSRLAESRILNEQSLHLMVREDRPNELIIRAIDGRFLPETYFSYFRFDDTGRFPLFQSDIKIEAKDLYNTKNGLHAKISRYDSSVTIYDKDNVERARFEHPKDEIITAISWNNHDQSLWFVTIDQSSESTLYRHIQNSDLSWTKKVKAIGESAIIQLVHVDGLTSSMVASQLTTDQLYEVITLTEDGSIRPLAKQAFLQPADFSKVNQERVCSKGRIQSDSGSGKNWLACWLGESLDDGDFEPYLKKTSNSQTDVLIEPYKAQASFCDSSCELISLMTTDSVEIPSQINSWNEKNSPRFLAKVGENYLFLSRSGMLKSYHDSALDLEQTSSLALANIADFGIINNTLAWAINYENRLFVISLGDGKILHEYHHPYFNNSKIQRVTSSDGKSITIHAIHWLSHILLKTIYLDPKDNYKALENWLNATQLAPNIIN